VVLEVSLFVSGATVLVEASSLFCEVGAIVVGLGAGLCVAFGVGWVTGAFSAAGCWGGIVMLISGWRGADGGVTCCCGTGTGTTTGISLVLSMIVVCG